MSCCHERGWLTRCEEYFGWAPPYCCFRLCYCEATYSGDDLAGERKLEQLVAKHKQSSCTHECKKHEGGDGTDFCGRLELNIKQDPTLATSGLSNVSCGTGIAL